MLYYADTHDGKAVVTADTSHLSDEQLEVLNPSQVAGHGHPKPRNNTMTEMV